VTSKKSLVFLWNARDLKNLPQNNRQHVISKMPQVLTVGSKSLAAGFATGNNYTRAAECNRGLPLDERAPNVLSSSAFASARILSLSILTE
jgi:hypothetical protein